MKWFSLVFASWLSIADMSLADEKSPANEKPANTIERHEPIDASGYLFNPAEWKRRKVSTQMVPWVGEHLAFLTWAEKTKDLDAETLKELTRQLNQAWAIYADVMASKPTTAWGWRYKDRTVMVATPGVFSGAKGMGYIGAHGIEVTSLYSMDYAAFQRTPELPWYYVYEMGRNWFTFRSDSFGLFSSSVAVHMGTVVSTRVKKLNGRPAPERELRALEAYTKHPSIDFDKHVMLNNGFALHTVIDPGSDRNGLYTEILIDIERRSDDDFLRRYYKCLSRCPAHYRVETRVGRMGQVVNWIAAASYGAKKNQAERFATEWHVPLSDELRGVFKEIDWRKDAAIEQILTGIKGLSSFEADGRDSTFQLAATGGNNAIRLSWSGRIAPGAVGFRVLRGDGEQSELQVIHEMKDAEPREYVDREIRPDVKYRYVLETVGASGEAKPIGQPVMANASSFVVRINCGGAAVNSWDGADWQNDEKNGHAALASAGTRVWTVKQPVDAVAGVPMAVLQTERWANRHIKFALPVEAGDYEVTIWFAETNRTFQAKGKRTIKIVMNGEEVASKLDIFAAAGANAPWAFRRAIPAKDAKLKIEVLADPTGPAIKGIEVRRIGNDS